MNKRDFNLDLFRAILAFLVVAEHFRNSIFLPFYLQDQALFSIFDYLFFGLTSLGKQAVIGFFCLSGYFVAISLHSLLMRDLSIATILKTFVIKRLTRIYTLFLPLLLVSLPLYYISSAFNPDLHQTLTAYGFGGSFKGEDTDISAFFPTLLLSPGLFGKGIWQGFSISWSLVNELWYYITASIIFLFCIYISKRSFSILSALVILATLIILFYFQVSLGVLRYFPSFLVASIIGWVRSSRPYLIFPPRLLHPAYCRLFPLAAVVVSPFVFLAAEEFFSSYQTLIVSSWVLLVLIFAQGYTPVSKINLLQYSAKFIRMISDISYSLYLSHMFLIIACLGAFNYDQLPVGLTAYLCFFLFILLSTVLSLFLFRLIDSRHYSLSNFLLSL